MSTLNIIGEFFQNDESRINFAAARDLTLALAQTAPRGHASTLLIASDTVPPNISHVKTSVAKIPMRTAVLPIMWHSNQAARPLDGEYLHAMSPLAPLRTREEDDGSQTSVMIPHSLAWDAPDTLPKGQARQIRSFTRRAIKHADLIVTPTHAIAQRMRSIYGQAINPVVLPLAAPKEYLGTPEAQTRRQELQLPEKYLLTTTSLDEVGRLDWVLQALQNNPELPHLVVVYETLEPDLTNWASIKDRVTLIKLERLSDFGDILNGAKALLMPQQIGDCFYPAYGALEQGVPIVHGENPCLAEIALESSLGGGDAESFAQAVKTVVNDNAERARLSILAKDRSKSFSWAQTAWQLWEIHANI